MELNCECCGLRIEIVKVGVIAVIELTGLIELIELKKLTGLNR